MSDATTVVSGIFRTESPAVVMHIAGRLLLAAGVGLVIGTERERQHKTAGLRTHMLVSIGSAIFVMALGTEGAGMDATSRVIQGVVQGIGFLGAGTILKLSDKAEVRGLTTAASIWLTAGLGVTAGLGHFWLPNIATAVAWVILVPVGAIERRLKQQSETRP